MDAFSDAVIAIILTIMVLDLTPVLKDNLTDYLLLSKEIGVYIISFAFVANMWYQHGTLFNEIDDMSYRIMLYDFLFLIPLSLTPLATNMMAENTTKITVIVYGLLVGITGFCFRLLARSITHFQYTDKSKMRQVYRKIFGQHNLVYVLINGILIVLAYFFPQVILWFYLPYPLVYMLLSSRDRQQMYDVSQLTTEQRQQYLRLPRDKMKQFRQLVETQKATNDAKPATQAIKPISWARWLDQPIGSGNGTKTASGAAQLNADTIREMRRAQWDEFERQTKSQKSSQQRAEDERQQQREAQREAAKQAAKERERQQDLKKGEAELAAKQREREQEAEEDAAKLAAKTIERQAKAKKEAAKQEIKIQERQQKAKRKADRKDAKALVRQKKLEQKARQYDAKDENKK